MLSPSYAISPTDLWNTLATPGAPQLVDVRRREVFDQSPQLLPAAVWRDAGKHASLVGGVRPRAADRRRLQGRP